MLCLENCSATFFKSLEGNVLGHKECMFIIKQSNSICDQMNMFLFSFFIPQLQCKEAKHFNLLKCLWYSLLSLKEIILALISLVLCSDEGLALEISALESLYGGQITIDVNSVDKTQNNTLHAPTDAATQLLVRKLTPL